MQSRLIDSNVVHAELHTKMYGIHVASHDAMTSKHKRHHYHMRTLNSPYFFFLFATTKPVSVLPSAVGR